MLSSVYVVRIYRADTITEYAINHLNNILGIIQKPYVKVPLFYMEEYSYYWEDLQISFKSIPNDYDVISNEEKDEIDTMLNVYAWYLVTGKLDKKYVYTLEQLVESVTWYAL